MMSDFSSAFFSESFWHMVEICFSWAVAFIVVTIISYALGASNPPLLNAKKRSEKLKAFIYKLMNSYSSDKKPGVSISVIYFKELRKLRAQAKKSLQVYIYDDGRHQNEAESIAALYKGIDNCTNRAITALTNEEYDVLNKNLAVINKLLDNVLKSLDSLIEKENKEKLLNFI